MIGLLASHPSLTLGLLVPAVLAVVLLVYLTVKYAPIIGQKFEEPPLFLPLRVAPSERGEPVAFPTRTGSTLAGTYLPGPDRGPGRRDGLLPRVPQRPMELPALHRSPPRPGL